MYWLFDPIGYDPTSHSWDNAFTNTRPIRITAHARQRFLERTAIPAEDVEWFTEQALLRGYTLSSCRGPFQRFLYEKSSKGLWAVSYMGLILLFAPSVDSVALVTVYPQPDCVAGTPACRGKKKKGGMFHD